MKIIELIILSFLISLMANFLLILISEKVPYLCDSFSGPQKNHSYPVPRVGGVGIFLGVFVSFLFLKHANFYFLVCALPVFLVGVFEDLYKRISPWFRLIMAFFSAILAMYLLDAILTRTDVFFLDNLLKYKPFSMGITLIAISGVINAINIMDGLNGLVSMITIIILMALSYVAFKVNDPLILSTSLILVAAILGFFIWNYPFGKIFLGDGGAYFLGFSISVLSLMLVNRNPEISPWFPFLLCIYPVFETLFSMYRRKVYKKVPSMKADRLHLHSLVYKRVVPQLFEIERGQWTLQNSAASPFCWFICTMAVLPSLLFWNRTLVLIVLVVFFCIFYIFLYKRIITFSLFSPKNKKNPK